MQFSFQLQFGSIFTRFTCSKSLYISFFYQILRIIQSFAYIRYVHYWAQLNIPKPKVISCRCASIAHQKMFSYKISLNVRILQWFSVNSYRLIFGMTRLKHTLSISIAAVIFTLCVCSMFRLVLVISAFNYTIIKSNGKSSEKRRFFSYVLGKLAQRFRTHCLTYGMMSALKTKTSAGQRKGST